MKCSAHPPNARQSGRRNKQIFTDLNVPISKYVHGAGREPINVWTHFYIFDLRISIRRRILAIWFLTCCGNTTQSPSSRAPSFTPPALPPSNLSRQHRGSFRNICLVEVAFPLPRAIDLLGPESGPGCVILPADCFLSYPVVTVSGRGSKPLQLSVPSWTLT